MLSMFTYFIFQQLILVKLIFVKSTPIKVLEKGILPLERDSVAIQFFLDLENEDKFKPCRLHCRYNKCCLINKEETDCASVNLFGEYDVILNPKDRDTYLFFYLTLSQLNQQGYCDFWLLNHCGYKKKMEEIRISFDTRLSKKQSQYLIRNFKGQNTKHCGAVDEDPLNNCEPVNCDVKYSGAKPSYSEKRHRCVEAPQCIADPKKKLPDIVYEPTSNICMDLDHSLSVADIYAISSGLGVTIQPNVSKNKENVMVYKLHCSTISQNLLFLKDLIFGQLSPKKGYTVDVKQSSKYALSSIFSCFIVISASLLSFVLCVNTSLWLLKIWKSGHFMTKDKNLPDYKCDCEDKISSVKKDLTNKLLREVIVSDLPLDLRNSVIDVCERIGKEVKWKKRYRMIDLGSEVNIRPVESSDTSTTSDLDTSAK